MELGQYPFSERYGWLTDRFGVTWQIVPAELFDMLSNEDEAKAGRAMQAMLKMQKIDLAEIRRAFNDEKQSEQAR